MIKQYLWHKVSRICTQCSANKTYYGDRRYGNYDEDAYHYWGWWHIQWLKLLRRLDD